MSSLRAIPGRMLARLRWLLARETLEPLPPAPPPGHGPVPRFLVDLLRGEHLPEDDPSAPTGEPRRGRLSSLFGREELHSLEAPPAAEPTRRKGLLKFLLAPDALEPLDELEDGRRPSALRRLFEREDLGEPPPVDAEGEQKKPGTLGWLLSRERLERADGQEGRED